MSNIILIGFMGSGKSVVGRALAAELKMDYLDTDELAEQAEKRRIPEIFKNDGEEYFRDVETEVLLTLQDFDNFVLSTGGGIILREKNIPLLKAMGPVILLWAEPEVIHQRVRGATHRPLLRVKNPREEIDKILEVRTPLYKKAADLTVDTSKLGPDQVAKEIREWLKSR